MQRYLHFGNFVLIKIKMTKYSRLLKEMTMIVLTKLPEQLMEIALMMFCKVEMML